MEAAFVIKILKFAASDAFFQSFPFKDKCYKNTIEKNPSFTWFNHQPKDHHAKKTWIFSSVFLFFNLLILRIRENRDLGLKFAKWTWLSLKILLKSFSRPIRAVRSIVYFVFPYDWKQLLKIFFFESKLQETPFFLNKLSQQCTNMKAFNSKWILKEKTWSWKVIKDLWNI